MPEETHYPTAFDLIAGEFEKAGLSCLLIGGFAVNSYGVTRQTLDIDFMIAGDDYAGIKQLLEEKGYAESQRQEIFARLKSPRPEWMDIDFMFVDRETLGPMIAAGQKVKIAGHEFTVPSLDHLIALKLHSVKHNRKMREYKDMLDILRLVEKNRINVGAEEFRKLCLKFGSADLYDDIVRKSGEA